MDAACVAASSVPTLPTTGWRHGRTRDTLGATTASSAASDKASENGEEEEATDGCADADDDAFVVVNP